MLLLDGDRLAPSGSLSRGPSGASRTRSPVVSADGLTHIDAHGHARMVDVTQKPQTSGGRRPLHVISSSRSAIASLTRARRTRCFAAARVIGIQAAKQTPDLIPLCHPLLIGDVALDFEIEADHIKIEARVESFGQTGVEMEALTACARRRSPSATCAARSTL